MGLPSPEEVSAMMAAEGVPLSGSSLPSPSQVQQMMDAEGASTPSLFSDPIGALTSADWWLTRPTGERISPQQAVAGPVSSALDALTLGGGDELTAGVNGVLDAVTGGPGYDARLAEARGIHKNFAEASPVVNGALELAYGLKTPMFSNVKTADPLWKTGLNLAKEGAVYGGVSGLNSGEGGLENRIASAKSGAKSGALISAILGTPLIGAAKLLSKAPEALQGASDDLIEKGLGVQYGERLKGLNRAPMYVDDAGNIVARDAIDTASAVEAPIQSQIALLKDKGLLAGAPDKPDLLKIDLEGKKSIVGSEIGNLTNKAHAAIGDVPISPEFSSAAEYLDSFRSSTKANLEKTLTGIVEDYANEPGTGFKKLTTFTDRLQKETNFDAATPREVVQLKRLAAYDLRRTAEGAFDAALPDIAGAYSDANKTFAALSTVSKTLNKRMAKAEPSVFSYLKGGSLPVSAVGSALAYPLGGLGAASAAGLPVVVNAIRKATEAKNPISAASLYEKLATGKIAGALGNAERNIGGIATAMPRVGAVLGVTEGSAASPSEARRVSPQAGRSSAFGDRGSPSPITPKGPQRNIQLPEVLPSPNIISARALTQPNPASDATVRSFMRSESVNAPKLKERTVKLDDPAHSAVLNDLADAVTSQESGGNVKAVSDKGAQGLMQLMPDTGKELFRKYRAELPTDASPKEYNPLNAKQNRALGTRYLAELIDKYNGDLELALTAYHTGMGTVDKLLRQVEGSKLSDIIEYLGPVGQKYARQVLARLNAKKTVKPKMSEA